MSLFDDEKDSYYLTYTTAPAVKYELTDKTKTTADKFIIKENLDGSISLIKSVANALPTATTTYADATAVKEDEAAAWKANENYDLSAKISTGLKTFMVEETPAISLPAVPQHISIEVARGGFMAMDENNDARLAITSEAGELVSSDTLRTVVDGKSVLVAEEDNAPKKIKGNLEKFQYQIVLDENGSDEYVIRQGKNYISQYNNYFYMDAGKKNAVRFLIEAQGAPTANEGVEVSEVKVIAGDGQVILLLQV